jgi:predicted RNA-binding Zn-ribbon protein involved in translation (DUF1610 family)
MTTYEIFAMETGPYIPPEHEGYGLLPGLRESGGEVFSYPAELDAIDEMVSEREDGPDAERRKSRLIPYNMQSYAEYFALLADYEERYREADPELAESIAWLAGAVRRMNVKEDWSVIRYVGGEYDGDGAPGLGLTKGRCYYWPCSREKPVYEGVIDDEEFTSYLYLYPCDPGSWEVVSDPTGMAARALAGDADTIDRWYPQMAQEPGAFDNAMMEIGAPAKRVRETLAFEADLDEGWSDSESDPVEFPCPGCGATVKHQAWTLVNARKSPELIERLLAGTLFEFACPECGYSASLRSPCLYLDPEHGACVYLVVNEDMAQRAAGMFTELDGEDSAIGRSEKRIVFDRQDLRGVAVTLANGLDDRVVEILKMAVAGTARQQGGVAPDGDCEVDLVGTEDDNLLFSVEADGKSLTAALPRGAYDLYADALARSSMAGEQPLVVDWAWAERAVDAFSEEGIL